MRGQCTNIREHAEYMYHHSTKAMAAVATHGYEENT